MNVCSLALALLFLLFSDSWIGCCCIAAYDSRRDRCVETLGWYFQIITSVCKMRRVMRNTLKLVFGPWWCLIMIPEYSYPEPSWNCHKGESILNASDIQIISLLIYGSFQFGFVYSGFFHRNITLKTVRSSPLLSKSSTQPISGSLFVSFATHRSYSWYVFIFLYNFLLHPEKNSLKSASYSRAEGVRFSSGDWLRVDNKSFYITLNKKE